MPGHWRQAAWIAAFACIAFGFGYELEIWRASQHHPDAVKIEAKKQSDRTNETKEKRGQQTEAAVNPTPLAQQDQAGKSDNITGGHAEKSGDEVSEYWTISGRRLKLTDTLLAVFTFLLIPVGLIQAYVLWRTVQHMRISERAHVSGGANRAQRRTDGSDVLVVTINNYGKTPAFIGTIAATICKEEELTNFPGWQVKDWKGYVFGPMPSQLSDIVFPYEKGKVIVGRIWYRDIFKKCYSVGFVLNTDDLAAVGSHESYWEEREEKNIRPD
jgi:hypothetical protein